MNILKSWLVWFCLLLNTAVLAFAIIMENYLAAAWIIAATFCFLNSERYFNELMEAKKRKHTIDGGKHPIDGGKHKPGCPEYFSDGEN